MQALFRVRSFPALFAGQATTTVGDSLWMLALAVWAKDLTGSNSVAGLTIFFMAVPYLSAPLTGLMVDRLNRKTVLVVGNIATGVAILPLLAVRDRDDVWLIFAVSVLYGWSFLVLSSALDGILKETIPDDDLAAANSALATVQQGARLIGPITGIGLYTVVGPYVVVLLNVVSFVVAAILISTIPVHRQPLSDGEPESWSSRVTTGLRHIMTSPAIRPSVLAVALAMLTFGMIEAVGFTFVDKGLGQPTSFVGVLVTAQGLGALCGGLIASRLIRWRGELAALGFGLAGMGISMCAMAFVTIAVALVGMFIMGVGLPISAVAARTLLQRRTPAAVIGRTSAAFSALTGIPQTLSIAVGAVLVTFVDYRLLLVVMGITILLAAAYAWRHAELAG